MKIALLSDIHGNATALAAVLAEIAGEQVDQVICLGDLLTGGPEPQQVVDLLRAKEAVLVLGNGDERLHHPVPLAGLSDHVRMLVDTEVWSRQLLPAADLAWLQQATLVHQTQVGGKELLCCHGSPHSVNDRLLAELSDEQLCDLLRGYRFDILAAGHTHIPMLRKLGRSLLLNPGAVGSPTGEGPLARYAVLTVSDGQSSVDFRSLAYDIAPAVEHARTGGMPHADWWVSNWQQ